MRCNSFGKNLVIFSLTFAAGSLSDNFFNSVEKPKLESVQQKIIISDNEVRKENNSLKPLCKRYQSDYDIELIRKETELAELLGSSENKYVSKTGKEKFRRKTEKLKKEIDKLMEKRKQEPKPSEKIEVSHNLLYVEKCAEY